MKHPGGALQDMGCSTSCLPAPNGTHLRVNCSDIYNSLVNGNQTNMGPKSDINPYTGVFAYPFTASGQTGNTIYKELQVHNTDLDPNLNAGARYFFEAQYIAADDAAAGNSANNCSYQQARLSVSNGAFNLAPGGETQIGKAAIQVWKALDPWVAETLLSLPSNGTYIVASKATFLGAGLWRYEYAVQNVNASRGAGSFTVPVPAGTHVSNIGFHDVDYHSGDSHDGVDWNGSADGSSVSWIAPSNEEFTFNALNWGTLYNSRFDADVALGSHQVVMGRFEHHSGDPILSTVAANAVTPSRCDGDGVCGPGEDCASCPGDCAAQGGGAGCCGDNVCSPGESALACFADCGIASSSETQCGDSVDNDRNGGVRRMHYSTRGMDTPGGTRSRFLSPTPSQPPSRVPVASGGRRDGSPARPSSSGRFRAAPIASPASDVRRTGTMTRIALLRAVNVGGRNLIAMSELRHLFADMGFADARTLLQSGNVVFDGGAQASGELEGLLEAQTEKRLKVRVDYMIRGVEEFDEIVAKNPFRREAKDDPGHLLVMFLKKDPSSAGVTALQSAIRGPERVRVAGRHVYVTYPEGIGRSKLTPGLIETKLGARGTGRNWNTVHKLLALAR